MQTKSLPRLGAIMAITVVAAVVSIGSLNVQAQNTTTTTSPQASQNQTAAADPQQIKNYLNQAILAVDSGNNTKALEQVDLVQDLIENMTQRNQTAAADPQQIKNYLNQAILAVDSGNNTKALEQVDEAQGLLEADPGALSQWLSSQELSLAEVEDADESGDAVR
jgi:DNA-binding phage protein